MLSAAIEGMFLNTELFGHQRGASNKGYKKIIYGTLVLSTQNLHLGNANVNLRFEHGMVSPAYKTYRIKDCSVKLLAEWIKSEKAKQFFYDATTVGASVCRRNVEWETLYDQTLYLPAINEQQHIAEFLSLVSKRICRQEKFIENLKKYKRGVLRKVFDHISISCKKSLLGNLCVSISSGKTTHVQDHGQYPLIGSTGPIGYTDIEEFNEELILIARVGANAGAVNYFAGSCGVTDNTLVVRVDKAYSVPEYILYFLEYYDPHRLIFGSGQPLVTGGQLKKIEVPIASKNQQEKVVELFILLNKYCTCAQQQLDLLICAKKALLQQLFI